MHKNYEIAHYLLEFQPCDAMDSMERASVRGKEGRTDKVVLPCIATATRVGEKRRETFN